MKLAAEREKDVVERADAEKKEYHKRRRKLSANINKAKSSFHELHNYIYREPNKVLEEELQKDKEYMDTLKQKASKLYDLIAEKLYVGEPETDPDVEQKAEEDNAPKIADDGQVSRESESEHDAAREDVRGKSAPDEDGQATERPGVCDEDGGRDRTEAVPERAEGHRDLGQEESKPSTESDPAGTSDEAEDAAGTMTHE